MPRIVTDEELNIINTKFSNTPFNKEDLFIFENRMIDTLEVSHGFVLHSNLIEKFNKDINTEGVGLLLAHDHDTLPVGMCFKGEIRRDYVEEVDEYSDTLYGVTYIPVNSRSRNTLQGVSTDDIALGIDDGTVRSTSIGFSFNDMKCNICGEDYRSWNCSHFAGRRYQVEQEDGTYLEQRCTPIIGSNGEGHLFENSLVFSGASGRAKVLNSTLSSKNDSSRNVMPTLIMSDELKGLPLDKPLSMVNSGDRSGFLVDPAVLNSRTEKPTTLSTDGGGDIVENDINKPTKQELGQGEDIQPTKVEDTNLDKSKLAEGEEVLSQLLAKDETIAELSAKNSSQEQQILELQEQIEGLKGNEEILSKVKESIKEEILTDGVRTYGNDYDKEMWSQFLDTLSFEQLMEQKEKSADKVATKFSANEGGERVSDSGDKELSRVGNTVETKEFREDFETEAEYTDYIAELALERCKADKSLNLSEETKRLYVEFSVRK